MRNYLDLLEDIYYNGEIKKDRTGTGTRSLFKSDLINDLRDGFPAVTTKELKFKSVAAELTHFLEGSTSLNRMQELGTHIWDKNAKDPKWQSNPECNGPDDMGRIYGAQWRNWDGDLHCSDPGIDQLGNIMNTIQSGNHGDRRMVVTAWNPGEIHQMCLPPCHIMYQFYVGGNGKYLDLWFYMRSVDTFLGMPFNIASYALLLSICANQLGMIPRYLHSTFGDTHLYLNHMDQAKLQLSRTPKPLPRLYMDVDVTIDNFHLDKASLMDYYFDPAIPAPMAN